MSYGNKPRSCLVYEYGGLTPTAGLEIAVAEMRKRNDLWNRLVEIDRAALAAQRAAIDQAATDYADLSKAERREVYKRPEVAAQVAAIDSNRRAQARQAARDSGLHWCNVDDVLASYELAQKKARREGKQLQFHAWHRQRGRLFVRWQTGLPVADAFSGDGRLRIAPVDPGAWNPQVRRGERRRLSRTDLSIRVQSDGRSPVWLTLPVVLHRPLPQGGLIRSVAVLRERIGPDWQWKAFITVEIPARQGRLPVGPACAVDLGWRRVPDGLRVAAIYDSEHMAGTLVLPEQWLQQMRYVAALQATRDQQINGTKAALAAWLSVQSALPEWLRSEHSHMGHWRSPGRFHSVWRQWRDNRFSGDEVGYELLAAWQYKDNHLHAWAANMRQRLLLHRRELYRLFAAYLVRNYNQIVIEDFDLRGVAEKKRAAKADETPAEKAQREAASAYRFLVAPSELRQAIANACQREGIAVPVVSAAYTTLTCPHCGSTTTVQEAREKVEIECFDCHRRRDQDTSAARLMLSAAELRSQP